MHQTRTISILEQFLIYGIDFNLQNRCTLATIATLSIERRQNILATTPLSVFKLPVNLSAWSRDNEVGINDWSNTNCARCDSQQCIGSNRFHLLVGHQTWVCGDEFSRCPERLFPQQCTVVENPEEYPMPIKWRHCFHNWRIWFSVSVATVLHFVPPSYGTIDCSWVYYHDIKPIH